MTENNNIGWLAVHRDNVLTWNPVCSGQSSSLSLLSEPELGMESMLESESLQFRVTE